MYLIAGLGNPGRKYSKTKHNAGFQAVDFLIGKQKWSKSKNAKAEYIRTQINNKEAEIIKPQTFMNNSGVSVAYTAKKHNIPSENIIVIYDELDLPFGEIRVRQEGSSAGHNGIKSITQHLGTDKFNRVRIGIDVPADPVKLRHGASKFVLKKFSRKELKELKETIFPQILEKIQEII